MQFKHWLINEEIFEQNNRAVVYHRTGKFGADEDPSIEGILNHGYKIGGGDAFGKGLYALMDLKEQVLSTMDGYGDKILKILVNDMRNYLITIPYYARKIFNDPNITLQKQIELLGIQIPKDDPRLEKYNQDFGFTNPISDMDAFTGNTFSQFRGSFTGLASTRNCKGVLYRDAHGLVMLLYAPFHNLLPLAWTKIPYPNRDPNKLVWHNIRAFSKINFADAKFDYQPSPRRLTYRVPRGSSSGGSLSPREVIDLLKFLSDENNYDNDSYLYEKNLTSVAEFFKAKKMKMATLFKHLPRYVIASMYLNDLIRLFDNSTNNNNEIMKIIEIKNLSSSDIDYQYAKCPNHTSNPIELRKELLKLDYNPNIQIVAQNINTSYEKLNDVIEFLIEESRELGKKINLNYLARISPILYFKETVKQGALDETALNKTIENLRTSNDIKEFLELIKDQEMNEFDVYNKVITQFMRQKLSLKFMVELIPESEIEKYFKSPANIFEIDYVIKNGYIESNTGESQNVLFLDMFFKYTSAPTDKQLASILHRVKGSYDFDEFEKTLDMVIQFRKTKNQFLSKDELIEIIQSVQKFDKQEILDKVPDENWGAIDNTDVRSLVYKFNRNTKLITKVAEKVLKFNKKIDSETKQYLEQVIKDPSNANKYIMIPSYQEISDIAAERVQNDSYYFKSILSSILQNMGNISLPQEKMAVLEKNIYDFAIERMNTDKPTEAMIDRVLHYLESEITPDLDSENFIKNIPINILEKIFIDSDYMSRFQKMLYKLKTQNNVNLSNVLDYIKNTLSSNPAVLKLFNVFLRKYRTGAYHY